MKARTRQFIHETLGTVTQEQFSARMASFNAALEDILTGDTGSLPLGDVKPENAPEQVVPVLTPVPVSGSDDEVLSEDGTVSVFVDDEQKLASDLQVSLSEEAFSRIRFAGAVLSQETQQMTEAAVAEAAKKLFVVNKRQKGFTAYGELMRSVLRSPKDVILALVDEEGDDTGADVDWADVSRLAEEEGAHVFNSVAAASDYLNSLVKPVVAEQTVEPAVVSDGTTEL